MVGEEPHLLVRGQLCRDVRRGASKTGERAPVEHGLAGDAEHARASPDRQESIERVAKRPLGSQSGDALAA